MLTGTEKGSYDMEYPTKYVGQLEGVFSEIMNFIIETCMLVVRAAKLFGTCQVIVPYLPIVPTEISSTTPLQSQKKYESARLTARSWAIAKPSLHARASSVPGSIMPSCITRTEAFPFASLHKAAVASVTSSREAERNLHSST